MKRCIFIIALFCFSQILGNNPDHDESFYALKHHASKNFSLGLESFGLSLDAAFPKNARIKGTTAHVGLYMQYEYRKPQMLYLALRGIITFNVAGSDSLTFHDKRDKSDSSIFFNWEGNIGYTLVKNDVYITPTFGVGRYTFGNHDRQSDIVFDSNRISYRYFSGGALFLWKQSPLLDVGANIAVYCPFDSRKMMYNTEKMVIGRSLHLGGSFSMPIMYGIQRSHGWNVRVEPHIFTLSFKELTLGYGARFLLGLNF